MDVKTPIKMAACLSLGLALTLTVLAQDDQSGAERPWTPTGSVQGKLSFASSKGKPLSKAPRSVIVSDAVLYLVGDGLTEAPVVPPTEAEALERAKQGPPQIDQVDIAFVPHVLPVAAGTTVRIQNSDAVVHNVHTYSRKNVSFNKTQAPKGSLDAVYDEPEVVHVGCDIHAQMSAYIVVVPNRFFTMPDKTGVFEISGIPPGKYELFGWHEKYGTVSQEIVVISGESTQATVTFKAKKKRGR